MGPFRYHLGESAMEVRIGPLTVRRIRYDDIAEVRPEYKLWNEHWTNFAPWRFVTLRRKSGLMRNFVINPADREAFIRDLMRRLPK